MISICRRRRRRRRRDERRNCPRMYTCERPQRDITVVCLHPRSELIGHCPDTSHINFKTLKKLNLTKQSLRRHCVFDHCRMLLLDVVFTKFCRVKMFLFWKYKSCKKSKSSWLFFCHMVSDFRKMQFIYNCLFTDRPGNKMVFFSVQVNMELEWLMKKCGVWHFAIWTIMWNSCLIQLPFFNAASPKEMCM